MRIEENILVLDTETIGTISQPLIYDIGYQILDKSYKVIKSQRFLIYETYLPTWLLSGSKFYSNKKSEYDKSLESQELSIIKWKKFVRVFGKDLVQYKVKTISAYNMAFDYRALDFTNQFLGDPINLMKKVNARKLLCLWELSTDKILNTIEFKEWAKQNNKLTDKGNYSTTVETVYNYLNNSTDFKQSHTSLEDVKIEVYILKYIGTYYKGVPKYGLFYSCWYKVQDKKT